MNLDGYRKKQLIYVSCTSAYVYPERPLYLLVRGRRYDVQEMLSHVKMQSLRAPSPRIHRYTVLLTDGRVAEIEYREQEDEWYLFDPEQFSEGGEPSGEDR